MFQGTGSDVGKSLIVAGLCRAFATRGLTVRPFKPQNMSNNAAVTADGGEIGRAQALQARACGVAPSVHMNPVLLKPQSEIGAQVVVQGRVVGNAPRRANIRPGSRSCCGRCSTASRACRREADLVLVEGAGSAAEVNLRARRHRQHGLCARRRRAGGADRRHRPRRRHRADRRHEGRARPRGRRDDRRLPRQQVPRRSRAVRRRACACIAERTGWPSLGLVPFFADAARLPAEDAVALERRAGRAGRAASRSPSPLLPHIANFDDFDPLRAEPGVRLVMVARRASRCRATPTSSSCPAPRRPSPTSRLCAREGWDIDILAHARRGGACSALCGGYQMLGRTRRRPRGHRGAAGRRSPGLGLLDVDDRAVGGTRRCTRVHGRLPRRWRAVRRLRDAYRQHERTGAARGRCCVFADGRRRRRGLAPTARVRGSMSMACSATTRSARAWLHGSARRPLAGLRAPGGSDARRARRASRAPRRPRCDSGAGPLRRRLRALVRL